MVEMVETAGDLNQATAGAGDSGRDRPRTEDVRWSLAEIDGASFREYARPVSTTARAVRHPFPRGWAPLKERLAALAALYHARHGVAEKRWCSHEWRQGHARTAFLRIHVASSPVFPQPLCHAPRRSTGGRWRRRAVGSGDEPARDDCRCLPPPRRGRRRHREASGLSEGREEKLVGPRGQSPTRISPREALSWLYALRRALPRPK